MATQNHQFDSDCIILGGGLVGQTLALALNASGLTSTIVDPANPIDQLAPDFDGRASAVASASWKMLEAIGLGDRLTGLGCPIRTIAVAEGTRPDRLTFDSQEGDAALGTMFANLELRKALQAAVAEAEHITLIAPAMPVSTERSEDGVAVTLADGRIVHAPLLIGAEGRNSPTREAAGLTPARWKYGHNAIIVGLVHERPHDHVAWEIFYPTGPFALLPMLDDAEGRHRSALVWSVADSDAPAMLALSDRAFGAAATEKSGGVLGALTPVTRRQTFPLGFHHSATIVATRMALVGDAAHGIHPIAGQGLNLGFRDVAALAEVLVEGKRLGMDLGDAQLLARYQRWRSFDTLSVASATDSLTRLFGLPGKTASAVRAAGLGAVAKIPPLKRFFMAEARGEAGELPRLLRGLPV